MGIEENAVGQNLIRRRLYAMRNGVVADSLRKAGCPRRLIWGVNLPQLKEIAAEFGPMKNEAIALRQDKDLRESFLLGTLLFPADELSRDEAWEWIEHVKWSEDADILCFALLKRVAFADVLAKELCERNEPLKRYAGLRLWFNLVGQHAEEALRAAEKELTREDGLRPIATSLAEEARYLLEG